MAETRTARTGMPSYGAGTDSFSRADWNEAAAQIEALMAIDAFGTRALRPAAGTRGRYYYASDTKVVFRDNGASWDVVGAAMEGPATITAAAAADVLMTYKGAASHSGNIVEYKSSTNVLLYNIAPDGSVVSVATVQGRLLRAVGTAVGDVPLRSSGIVGQTANLFEALVNAGIVSSINASGDNTSRSYAPTGLPGAVSASRFVGSTASGAPTTGTFAIGDFIVARNGSFWICTVAGSPGTWVEVAASVSSSPPGMISAYGGAAAPSGWVLCDGSAISRTTFAALYAALGGASSPFGQGDGSTTFNVPNLKGRFVVGIDAAQTEFDTRGETGGSKAVTLATANLPSHTHAIDHDHAAFASAGGSAHAHTISVSVNSGGGNTSAVGNHNHNIPTTATGVASGIDKAVQNEFFTPGQNNTTDAGAHSHDYTHAHSTSASAANESAHTHSIDVPAFTGTSGSQGSGTAFNNMPPYTALNYIIKT